MTPRSSNIVQQPIGVALHAALERVPGRDRRHTVEGADVEVVFHVDRHGVEIMAVGRVSTSLRPPRSSTVLTVFDDDEEVERHVQVLDVEQIVLQLLAARPRRWRRRCS